MKLLKLTLENLNSFQQKVELDFAENRHLKDASLLAITGPTGSGKTTLLDALCVALYNRTPRLSSTGNQNPSNLLSQGKTEGFSEIIFEANGTRYLSEWRVSRKRNGELNTPKVLLKNHETEKLISERRSSHSRAIQEILGLDFESFNRSVLLAQGQFAAFLKADVDTRRQILEATTGVDIYDRLRQPLNARTETVTLEYEKIETAFNGIPAVTSEELKRLQVQLQELENETRSLEEKQKTIQQQIKKERDRSLLNQQLTDAQSRRTQLMQEQPQIDRIQSNFDKAERAARIDSEAQLFQKARQNSEDAQSALTETERELENTQSEYDEIKATFDRIDAEYQSMVTEYAPKMEVYNEARTEEIRAQTQFDEIDKRKYELKTVNKTIDQLTIDLTSRNKEKVKLEQTTETDKMFLNAHPLPTASDQDFSQAKAHFATLTEKEKIHRSKSKALTEIQSRIAQQERDLDALEQDLEILDKKKGLADAHLTETELLLKYRQGQGSMETWRAQKENASQMSPLAREYENVTHQRSEMQKQLDKKHEALREAKKQVVEFKRTLDMQLKDVEIAEVWVKQCQAEEKSALIANQVILLRREHLQPEKPCPVCGAIEHPWANKEEPEGEAHINHAQRALTEATTQLQHRQEHQNTLQEQYVFAEKTQDNLHEQISDLNKQIGMLDEEIRTKIVQWRTVYPKSEPSLKYIDDKIDEVDLRIEQLQTVMQAHTQASNDQKFAIQSWNNQAEKNQSMETDLKDCRKQHQGLTDELNCLDEEIRTIEANLWEFIPDTFHGGIPQEALNQFEEQIHAVRTCKESLTDKQSQLDRLSTEIRSTAGQLESENQRKKELDSEITQYQVEGDTLLAACAEKTGGLTAAEAIQKLEAEIAAITEQRNKAEKILREKQERIIKTQTHKNRAESEAIKCNNEFDAARGSYQGALANAQFDSIEAHEQACRDDSWLEASKTRLQQYNNEQYTIESRIAELEMLFAAAPFDPCLIKCLQDAESNIAAQLKTNITDIGELRKTLDDMETHHREREKQGLALEKAHKEKERWQILQKEIGNNRLRNFALQRTFDRLVHLTNQQLERVTDRYALKVESMKDMAVLDKWNANEARPVETLSGGESFLTSLSLALALSEMSRGPTQLNSLFLDEGFGTLDTDTLDVAITALEGLQLQGHSIFLISHVGELTRRIPVQIAVEKMGNGSSQVQVHGSSYRRLNDEATFSKCFTTQGSVT